MDPFSIFDAFEAFAYGVSILYGLVVVVILVDIAMEDHRQRKAQRAVERRHQQYLIDAQKMTRLANERQAKRKGQ